MPNTREKLIELIGAVQYLGGLEENLADHLIANGVRLEQATSDETSKWTPVTERPPEKCDRFLVYGSRGGIYTAEFRKFSDFGGEYPHWHKLNSKNHHCEPTHWMPLPEPPKGE